MKGFTAKAYFNNIFTINLLIFFHGLRDALPAPKITPRCKSTRVAWWMMV